MAVAGTASDEPLAAVGDQLWCPGDRRERDGQLWMEYPAVAGDSAPVEIQINAEAKFFQHHSSLLADAQRPWVLASGVENITELEMGLRLKPPFDLAGGLPVEHADDDAEEGEDGDVSLSSSDLELVQDSKTQTVGVRFNRINIARGTKIRSARLQFTCDEPSDEATNLLIAIEQTGNAKRFSATSHDISSRQKSTAEVAWQPKAWAKSGAAGKEQQTPELAKLVQSVIDRADWRPGNSLAFVISGRGKRLAKASTGPTTDAPRLILDADVVDTEEIIGRQTPMRYDVRLHFAASPLRSDEVRVFDIYAQDQLVASDVRLDPRGSIDERCAERVIEDLSIAGKLRLRFVPKRRATYAVGNRID